MAVQELTPGEKHDFNGIHFFGELDKTGEILTYALLDGWAKREFVLEIDSHGGHVDFISHEGDAPAEENQRLLGAIAILARAKNPEIITVEDMDGNLL